MTVYANEGLARSAPARRVGQPTRLAGALLAMLSLVPGGSASSEAARSRLPSSVRHPAAKGHPPRDVIVVVDRRRIASGRLRYRVAGPPGKRLEYGIYSVLQRLDNSTWRPLYILFGYPGIRPSWQSYDPPQYGPPPAITLSLLVGSSWIPRRLPPVRTGKYRLAVFVAGAERVSVAFPIRKP